MTKFIFQGNFLWKSDELSNITSNIKGINQSFLNICDGIIEINDHLYWNIISLPCTRRAKPHPSLCSVQPTGYKIVPRPLLMFAVPCNQVGRDVHTLIEQSSFHKFLPSKTCVNQDI